MDAAALILFADIRNFTRWSDAIEVFAHLNRFVAGFLGIIRKHFPESVFIKPLGDGVLIVRELPPAPPAPGALLAEILRTIEHVEREFDILCKQFAQEIGHRTELRLGWSIVRGAVRRVDGDYVGSNLNKGARLCDAARPFGVVIDRDDFPEEPSVSERFRFYPQTRKLTGIADDVEVWATSEIASQFIARESLKESPEVHVAGLCVDTNDKRGLRILLARRTRNRRLYPGLLEGCGGQLARSESFTQGVQRHFRLEMGIDVRVIEDIHCFYEIREPNEPLIPGIRFLCERVGDQEPRSSNHTEIAWVLEADFREMPAEEFIPGLKDQFTKLIEQYKRQA